MDAEKHQWMGAGAAGAFGWPGAFGTWWQADPANDLILIYLILGDDSGVFVKSVADNVTKFAGAVPTPSLIGIGVIIALIVLVMQRVR